MYLYMLTKEKTHEEGAEEGEGNEVWDGERRAALLLDFWITVLVTRVLLDCLRIALHVVIHPTGHHYLLPRLACRGSTRKWKFWKFGHVNFGHMNYMHNMSYHPKIENHGLSLFSISPSNNNEPLPFLEGITSKNFQRQAYDLSI